MQVLDQSLMLKANAGAKDEQAPQPDLPEACGKPEAPECTTQAEKGAKDRQMLLGAKLGGRGKPPRAPAVKRPRHAETPGDEQAWPCAQPDGSAGTAACPEPHQVTPGAC